MNAESPSQWIWGAASWLHARPALLGTFAGGALGVSTIILSAINAISAQQAIAMALPAIITLVGGLLYMMVHDPWIAWQRGFQQGYQASMSCRMSGLDPGVSAAPGPDGVPEADRPAPPIARAALRKVQ
jgi:hypothetical protein